MSTSRAGISTTTTPGRADTDTRTGTDTRTRTDTNPEVTLIRCRRGGRGILNRLSSGLRPPGTLGDRSSRHGLGPVREERGQTVIAAGAPGTSSTRAARRAGTRAGPRAGTRPLRYAGIGAVHCARIPRRIPRNP